MGMEQNYLFSWGWEIPCSENIEPSYLQIFDNKYFVYEQFRMLYRFSGPSDCWKIPFPRFLPTRNFPVRRNFSGFMPKNMVSGGKLGAKDCYRVIIYMGRAFST